MVVCIPLYGKLLGQCLGIKRSDVNVEQDWAEDRPLWNAKQDDNLVRFLARDTDFLTSPIEETSEPLESYTIPVIPTSFSSIEISKLWSTVSKAAERSSNITTVALLSVEAMSKSFTILTRSVSVL